MLLINCIWLWLPIPITSKKWNDISGTRSYVFSCRFLISHRTDSWIFYHIGEDELLDAFATCIHTQSYDNPWGIARHLWNAEFLSHRQNRAPYWHCFPKYPKPSNDEPFYPTRISSESKKNGKKRKRKWRMKKKMGEKRMKNSLCFLEFADRIVSASAS